MSLRMTNLIRILTIIISFPILLVNKLLLLVFKKSKLIPLIISLILNVTVYTVIYPLFLIWYLITKFRNYKYKESIELIVLVHIVLICMVLVYYCFVAKTPSEVFPIIAEVEFNIYDDKEFDYNGVLNTVKLYNNENDYIAILIQDKEYDNVYYNVGKGNIDLDESIEIVNDTTILKSMSIHSRYMSKLIRDENNNIIGIEFYN